MRILSWLIMITMVIYTVGFAVTLWKGRNKPGAIAVFLLAIGIVVVPFFSVLR